MVSSPSWSCWEDQNSVYSILLYWIRKLTLFWRTSGIWKPVLNRNRTYSQVELLLSLSFYSCMKDVAFSLLCFLLRVETVTIMHVPSYSLLQHLWSRLLLWRLGGRRHPALNSHPELILGHSCLILLVALLKMYRRSFLAPLYQRSSL